MPLSGTGRPRAAAASRGRSLCPGHRLGAWSLTYPHYRAEQEVLAPFGAAVEPIVTSGDVVRIQEAVRDADAVLVRETPLGPEAAMERCRVIVRYGVGVDHIDLEAARRRRIFVANVPDYGTEEVAEHALALLLAVARHITRRDRDVRRGRWAVGPEGGIYRLRGRVLGIVGFGRIGRAFFRKAGGLGFARVLVHDPFITAPPEQGVELVGLEQTLPGSSG